MGDEVFGFFTSSRFVAALPGIRAGFCNGGSQRKHRAADLVNGNRNRIGFLL